MAKMIATQAFKYGSRQLTAGDEFDAESNEHVVLLEATLKARRREPVIMVREKRKYRTREMKAED